jgi:hypothetical protein
LPFKACCPTHAIIWEMLMKEPFDLKVDEILSNSRF